MAILFLLLLLPRLLRLFPSQHLQYLLPEHVEELLLLEQLLVLLVPILFFLLSLLRVLLLLLLLLPEHL
jgi:hypothetical protein